MQAFGGALRFLVFIRLPEGRKATMACPAKVVGLSATVGAGAGTSADQAKANPELPSFPEGTEVALVRQMTLFDNQGNLAAAPITESVQIRVYHAIASTPAGILAVAI